MSDEKQPLFCPFLKEACRQEDCALYLKDAGRVAPGHKNILSWAM